MLEASDTKRVILALGDGDFEHFAYRLIKAHHASAQQAIRRCVVNLHSGLNRLSVYFSRPAVANRPWIATGAGSGYAVNLQPQIA